MPELLKNMYNSKLLTQLATNIKSVFQSFSNEEFLKSVMDETWNNLELKARTRKISTNLGKYLPSNYEEAIAIIDKVIAIDSNFFGLFIPDFIEVYGQDEADWNISINALERYTKYWSSEFAVRPFIINNEKRMMAQMYAWSKDENEHVRRLASEGCRPQLPWGQALVSFKKDPTPILPILEQLKTDSSLYVRKSVANNLNDISKTHPELVIKIASDWYGKSQNTDWIVKHGCRTLLKKGNREALALFGLSNTNTDINNFVLKETSVAIGNTLTFSFEITAKEPTKVRLEYAIDYIKSNGKHSRKIFQISEISLTENEKKHYKRKHSFADLSTRKHYCGLHIITLIVNGIESEKGEFDLVAK